MNPYRKRPITDADPVRPFGDRVGYWITNGRGGDYAFVLFSVAIPAFIAALAIRGCNAGTELQLERARMHERSAGGACRDVWLATENATQLNCPHVQHRLTANAQWVRCECKAKP